jgi:hypothetical protein
MTAALEKRIAGALKGKAAAADLEALIAETEAAIGEADATAEAERARALDLLAAPDAAEAHQAMQRRVGPRVLRIELSGTQDMGGPAPST